MGVRQAHTRNGGATTRVAGDNPTISAAPNTFPVQRTSSTWDHPDQGMQTHPRAQVRGPPSKYFLQAFSTAELQKS